MIRLLSIGVVALGWMELALPAPAQDSAEKLVLDLGGDVKMEFVKIKAGKFMMGDKIYKDATPHEVTISKDYWMQTTETTQAQWEAVTGKNPSRFKGAEFPVESVSWKDCREFLKKLNEKAKEQLKGKSAKLPTEAEWEYACRAGGKGLWSFRNDYEDLNEYAWYFKNSHQKTHPVGRKKANAWGLYDMYGNVLEWCEDWYEEQYPSETVTDPTGPAEGKFRCRRGGNYSDLSGADSSLRFKSYPVFGYDGCGLRATLH